jgi:hypothetical protein
MSRWVRAQAFARGSLRLGGWGIKNPVKTLQQLHHSMKKFVASQNAFDFSRLDARVARGFATLPPIAKQFLHLG